MHQVFKFDWFFEIKRCSKFTFQKIFSNLRRWNVKIGFLVLPWKGLFSEKQNLVDKFFSKTFWKRVRFGIRFLHPGKFIKKILQLASEFDSSALQGIRLWTHFAFFTNQVLTTTSLSKTNFCIFLQRKNANFGSFVLSYKEWIWENKLAKTDFESKNFDTGVSTNQPFSRLVSFWIDIFKLCQIMNQHFYNASGFQIEIFSFKIKFCSKTCFKKFFC